MSAKLDIEKIANVYLLGIGGIGMSALARYFKVQGKSVSGYDKTSTPLTDLLQSEGIDVHFEDKLTLVPEAVLSQKDNTLVIYTPAVPNNHYEYNYFKERGYQVMKRSEVLGQVFSSQKGAGVAGTHGKTTTSTMLAHLLKQSHVDCSAFLGGISRNYNTNLLLTDKSNVVVAEADEFDRSFLRLFPYLTIVTSVDPDHLDIYGTYEEVIKSFNAYIAQIRKGGILIYKKGIKLDVSGLTNVDMYTYSITDKADFYPSNIRNEKGFHTYDLNTPEKVIKGLVLGVPGLMNLENSVAASAAALMLGVSEEELRGALSSFEGVKRRFEYHIRTEDVVYIDDYAHHPEELKACITSARNLYPDKKITGIFQPHLFTRTRDFADGFAESLSLLDELILLEIYPAREEPIPGITSDIIFDKVSIANKTLCTKDDLLSVLKTKKIEILMTIGAGDIDRMVDDIKDVLQR